MSRPRKPDAEVRDYGPENARLASILRAARIANGRSQADVAARLKISQRAVAHYETGESRIFHRPLGKLEELAAAFGANMRDIFVSGALDNHSDYQTARERYGESMSITRIPVVDGYDNLRERMRTSPHVLRWGADLVSKYNLHNLAAVIQVVPGSPVDTYVLIELTSRDGSSYRVVGTLQLNR